MKQAAAHLVALAKPGAGRARALAVAQGLHQLRQLAALSVLACARRRSHLEEGRGVVGSHTEELMQH